MNYNNNDKRIFWGSFIALITTSMAFIIRAFLINDSSLWPAQFGFDKVRGGELFGAGIWPFAISILLFSLVFEARPGGLPERPVVNGFTGSS